MLDLKQQIFCIKLFINASIVSKIIDFNCFIEISRKFSI